MAKANKRKVIDKVLTSFGVVATLALLTIGGLAWWAYSFTSSNVHDELAAQKIYFPPKGSPALNPDEFPDLQKYAGQLVDNGPKAQAYANGFIGRHLEKVADGKTYSEVSTLALKDPTNEKLKAQKQTLFQGETLRGLLLGDGYAYWTFGQIMEAAAIAAFAGTAVMTVLVMLGARRLR